MKLLLFAFLAVSLHSSVWGLKFTDCGSTAATVTEVKVSGCENVDVCPLKRGTKADLSVKFDSKSTSKTLQAVVHGIIGGVPLPFPPPEPDACKNSGLSCPLSNGQSYTYSTHIDVRNSYPPLKVEVKWELQDENGADVLCVKIPTQIT